VSVERFGRNPGQIDTKLDRSCQIAVHNGLAYFVATPDKPYDPSLSAGEQMKQALELVDERLKIVDSDKRDVLMVQVWLSDIRYFQEVNRVWDAWVDQENLPVRCCCAVDLGNTDMKLELVVTTKAGTR
jgi:enamine deaminase RidA (YjgF/YER057c/UK114 family)